MDKCPIDINNSRIVVIGGGVTGQLVQFCIPHARILDWSKPPKNKRQLTRMFGANYLWEPLENIECKKFTVITHVDGSEANYESIRRYKEKIGKSFDQAHWDAQFKTVMEGYNIVSLPDTDISYECRVKEIFVKDKRLLLSSGIDIQYDVLISTIPLYALMDMCNIPHKRPFQYKPIYIRIEERPLEAPYPEPTWYINYLSDPDIPPYRYTDRDKKRHYEGLTSMGRIPTRKISPGKIYPNPIAPLVLESLEKDSIFCFGRFGRWDPEELLHSTYSGIKNWIRHGSMS
jgi:hypothetical protein